MAFYLHFFFILFTFISLDFVISKTHLKIDYYKNSCPDFQKIIRETITSKQVQSPTTAAGTLRLFFHDCFVEGCDASVLVATNPFNHAEREADINHSLPGDAYDVIVRAKTALELSCPSVVSCSDILAQATRDLITMVGGPFYHVLLGRKDGFISHSTRVGNNIPHVNMTMDQLIEVFASKGFTIQEMVALSGGHTIGFSHCKEFTDRLFAFSKSTPTDPEINPKFAAALKAMCANYTTSPTTAAFNDVITPGKFDNMYFKNLGRGLGLLATDHMLIKDIRTKSLVQLYAVNQTIFFNDFARAMEKLSRVGIKTGRRGEVRRRCDAFNEIQT
ncbi:peroxidase 41-like [Carica papaya]|uniref:peroxidase 41-like n=1 Tax=Carica papaya TaxID=3649 RepID=UPI000B8C9FC5|nr:peroxidase 41-like [Carica papaya]